VPTKHNRPYELALETAQASGVLLARGAEITRETPPGHFNAIFLSDVRPLETGDFLEAVKRASEQGAFVFWNHQGWQGAEKGRWLDVHTTIVEKKWLRGMEVCNGDEYYPQAHQWCLDKKLTMMGDSDIHEPDLRQQSAPGDHRTMTLVFAKEKTLPALKEALLAGRTAVWYKNQLIGRSEWLDPLFKQCLRVAPPHRRSGKAVWVRMQNLCDVDLRLERSGDAGPARLDLPARTTSVVEIQVAGAGKAIELKYTAKDFLIAPRTGLPVTLRIPAP
jgi:3',5'-nucleoside bisphosphate phosphatase